MVKLSLRSIKYNFKSIAVIIIGLGLIAGLGSLINWNLSTRAAGDIFNGHLGHYFGRGSSRPNHNVLPPIHIYSSAPNGNPLAYAINVSQFLGVGNSTFHGLHGNYDVSIDEGNDSRFTPAFFLSQVLVYAEEAKHALPYDQYVQRVKQGDVSNLGQVSQCIHSWRNYLGEPVAIKKNPVSKATYEERKPKCISWFATGYDYLLKSAVGLPKNKANNASEYTRLYSELVNDPNKKLTIQWMGAGGKIHYYKQARQNGLTGEARYPKFNTAINAERNDVIGYDRGGSTIKPSVAIVIWDKNGESPSDPPKVRWVVRLKCANPIGGDLSVVKNKVDAKVSANKPSVTLLKGGEARVDFNYEIYKNVAKIKNKDTTIKYKFSGNGRNIHYSGDVSFNHNHLHVTAASPAGIASGALSSNPVDIGSDVVKAKINYKESVVINWANRGTVWKQIDNTKGYICRTAEAWPKDPRIPNPNNLPNYLKASSVDCVKISFNSNKGSGIYLNKVTPDIASIADPIAFNTKGLNSWAHRPKQWSYWHKPLVFDPGECISHDDSDGMANAINNINKNLKESCDDICKKNPEDYIECSLKNVKIKSFCCDTTEKGRCIATQYHGHGQCYHKKREEGANWFITKYIFKPEKKDNNSPLGKKSMSSPTSETPCQYYTGKSADDKYCKSYASGSHAFDDVREYSLAAGHGPNDLMGIAITPLDSRIGGSTGDDSIKLKIGGMQDVPYNVEDLPAGTQVCFGASMNLWVNGGNKSGLPYDKPGYQENSKVCDGIPNWEYECKKVYSEKKDKWYDSCGWVNRCTKYTAPRDLESAAEAAGKEWLHSEPYCFIVSKKPYFVVRGGQLLTNGRVITNLNRRNADASGQVRIAGSWSQYATVATGDVSKHFATNAWLATTALRVPPMSTNDWHKLTFANQSGYGGYGEGVTNQLVDPMAVLAGQDGEYASTKINQLSSGAMGGSHASGIYVREGDLTINDNISSSDGGQIMLLINGNLTVNKNVGNVNAWVYVTGTLYTSDRPVNQRDISNGIEDDEKPLIFNGPVRANQIKLRRTHGSGIKTPKHSLSNPREQLNLPAETFRDTPGTYIWAYENSRNKGRLQTVYLREVAPRY